MVLGHMVREAGVISGRGNSISVRLHNNDHSNGPCACLRIGTEMSDQVERKFAEINKNGKTFSSYINGPV